MLQRVCTMVRGRDCPTGCGILLLSYLTLHCPFSAKYCGFLHRAALYKCTYWLIDWYSNWKFNKVATLGRTMTIFNLISNEALLCDARLWMHLFKTDLIPLGWIILQRQAQRRRHFLRGILLGADRLLFLRVWINNLLFFLYWSAFGGCYC